MYIYTQTYMYIYIHTHPNLYEEKFIIANKYHTYDTHNSQCLRSTFFKLDIYKN